LPSRSTPPAVSSLAMGIAELPAAAASVRAVSSACFTAVFSGSSPVARTQTGTASVKAPPFTRSRQCSDTDVAAMNASAAGVSSAVGGAAATCGGVVSSVWEASAGCDCAGACSDSEAVSARHQSDGSSEKHNDANEHGWNLSKNDVGRCAPDLPAGRRARDFRSVETSGDREPSISRETRRTRSEKLHLDRGCPVRTAWEPRLRFASSRRRHDIVRGPGGGRGAAVGGRDEPAIEPVLSACEPLGYPDIRASSALLGCTHPPSRRAFLSRHEWERGNTKEGRPWKAAELRK